MPTTNRWKAKLTITNSSLTRPPSRNTMPVSVQGPFKKRIIVPRTVRNMFGEQTVRPIKNGLNYYVIQGPRNKVVPPTSQQIGQFHPKRVKYRHRHLFLFLFLPHPQESSLCSQPVRCKVCRTGQIFPKHAERSFLDTEYTELGSRSKGSPN